jgi:uncharacterized ion transporter superfamily protein YfcC
MTMSREVKSKRSIHLHPLLMMLAMLLAAIVLTHIVPSGKYERQNGHVVPGSYVQVPKVNGVAAFLSSSTPKADETPARAAGIVALFTSIPAGMTKSTGVIFMIMFVGGLFGVLQRTGAVEAGIDRLLHLATGNIYLLTSVLMFVIASAATFLGLFSEFLAFIPLVLLLGNRYGLPKIYAPAVVFMSIGVGYAASVTNPIVLGVAQPLAQVPIFSGMLPRLVIFIIMFGITLSYMLFYLRRLPKLDYTPENSRLSSRHVAVLISLVIGALALIIGTAAWSWEIAEHAALFIAWAAFLAMAGGIRAGAAADAFLDGMKFMMLPCAMIGLAGALGIILQSSQVLDSVVQGFAFFIEGREPHIVAGGILLSEMSLDVIIHSTSSKAAISLPILTPIAQYAGLSGNISVSALTMGGGLMNLIVPTNGTMLAFIAAAKVDYGDWARFVGPLVGMLFLVAFGALYVMTTLGL